MVTAVLDGRLREVKTEPHPVFGIHVPVVIPGVPADVLNPRNTWQDKAAYDEKAQALWAQFEKNYDLLINNPGAVGVISLPK